MVNRNNLVMDSQIKREKELTFGVITKFDSQINFWGGLVRESGATPIHILKETWWTRPEPFITWPELKCTQWDIPSRTEHSATCQTLRGCWWYLIPWVPHLLNSTERNRGPTLSQPTQPKDTGQEVHNRGYLEDNYRSNLINMASRDRVRVKYNDNWPNLSCKPYPS
jgi:hypothetical protein